MPLLIYNVLGIHLLFIVMASDKEIARPEEFSDSEDEADDDNRRRHISSHKEEPTAKRPKVMQTEKIAEKLDEEDIKNKAEEKVKSLGSSPRTGSPKPASPKPVENKTIENNLASKEPVVQNAEEM